MKRFEIGRDLNRLTSEIYNQNVDTYIIVQNVDTYIIVQNVDTYIIVLVNSYHLLYQCYSCVKQSICRKLDYCLENRVLVFVKNRNMYMYIF